MPNMIGIDIEVKGAEKLTAAATDVANFSNALEAVQKLGEGFAKFANEQNKILANLSAVTAYTHTLGGNMVALSASYGSAAIRANEFAAAQSRLNAALKEARDMKGVILKGGGGGGTKTASTGTGKTSGGTKTGTKTPEEIAEEVAEGERRKAADELLKSVNLALKNNENLSKAQLASTMFKIKAEETTQKQTATLVNAEGKAFDAKLKSAESRVSELAKNASEQQGNLGKNAAYVKQQEEARARESAAVTKKVTDAEKKAFDSELKAAEEHATEVARTAKEQQAAVEKNAAYQKQQAEAQQRQSEAATRKTVAAEAQAFDAELKGAEEAARIKKQQTAQQERVLKGAQEASARFAKQAQQNQARRDKAIQQAEAKTFDDELKAAETAQKTAAQKKKQSALEYIDNTYFISRREKAATKSAKINAMSGAEAAGRTDYNAAIQKVQGLKLRASTAGDTATKMNLLVEADKLMGDSLASVNSRIDESIGRFDALKEHVTKAYEEIALIEDKFRKLPQGDIAARNQLKGEAQLARSRAELAEQNLKNEERNLKKLGSLRDKFMAEGRAVSSIAMRDKTTMGGAAPSGEMTAAMVRRQITSDAKLNRERFMAYQRAQSIGGGTLENGFWRNLFKMKEKTEEGPNAQLWNPKKKGFFGSIAGMFSKQPKTPTMALPFYATSFGQNYQFNQKLEGREGKAYQKYQKQIAEQMPKVFEAKEQARQLKLQGTATAGAANRKKLFEQSYEQVGFAQQAAQELRNIFAKQFEVLRHAASEAAKYEQTQLKNALNASPAMRQQAEVAHLQAKAAANSRAEAVKQASRQLRSIDEDMAQMTRQRQSLESQMAREELKINNQRIKSHEAVKSAVTGAFGAAVSGAQRATAAVKESASQRFAKQQEDAFAPAKKGGKKGADYEVAPEATGKVKNLGNSLTNLAQQTNLANNSAMQFGMQGLLGMAEKAENSHSKMLALAGSLSKIGIAGTVAMGAATAGIIGFGVASNSKLEAIKIGFTTLLGSEKAAAEHMQELQKFAANTPFEQMDLYGYSQKMQAFGFKTKEVIPALTAMGDAVSGLGGGKELLGQVIMAVGQMKAKGKVQGDEILQLTEAGIPALQILATANKKTTEQMSADISSGTVKADKAIEQLLAGMEQKFPNLMAKMSDSAEGMKSNLIDWATMSAQKITEPFFQVYKSGLRKALDFTNTPEAANLVNILTAFSTKAAGVIQKIGVGFSSIGNVISTGLRVGGDALKTFSAALHGDWADAMGIGKIARVFGYLGLALQPIVGISRAVSYAFHLIRDSIITFRAALSGNWTDNGRIERLVASFGHMGEALRPTGNIIGNFYQQVRLGTNNAMIALHQFRAGQTEAAKLMKKMLPGEDMAREFNAINPLFDRLAAVIDRMVVPALQKLQGVSGALPNPMKAVEVVLGILSGRLNTFMMAIKLVQWGMGQLGIVFTKTDFIKLFGDVLVKAKTALMEFHALALPIFQNIADKGGKLFQGLTGGKFQGKDLTDTLKAIAPVVASAAAAFFILHKALGPTGQAFGFAATGVKTFGGVLGFLMSPIGLVIGALALIGTAAALAFVNWDGLLKNVTGALDTVSSVGLKGLQGGLKVVGDIGKSVFDGILTVLKDVAMIIGGFAASLVVGVVLPIKEAFETLAKGSNTFTVLKENLDGLIRVAVAVGFGLGSLVGQVIRFIIVIGDLILRSAIIPNVFTAIGVVLATVGETIAVINGVISSNMDGIATAVNMVGMAIQTALGAALIIVKGFGLAIQVLANIIGPLLPVLTGLALVIGTVILAMKAWAIVSKAAAIATGIFTAATQGSVAAQKESAAATLVLRVRTVAVEVAMKAAALATAGYNLVLGAFKGAAAGAAGAEGAGKLLGALKGFGGGLGAGFKGIGAAISGMTGPLGLLTKGLLVAAPAAAAFAAAELFVPGFKDTISQLIFLLQHLGETLDALGKKFGQARAETSKGLFGNDVDMLGPKANVGGVGNGSVLKMGQPPKQEVGNTPQQQNRPYTEYEKSKGLDISHQFVEGLKGSSIVNQSLDAMRAKLKEGEIGILQVGNALLSTKSGFIGTIQPTERLADAVQRYGVSLNQIGISTSIGSDYMGQLNREFQQQQATAAQAALSNQQAANSINVAAVSAREYNNVVKDAQLYGSAGVQTRQEAVAAMLQEKYGIDSVTFGYIQMRSQLDTAAQALNNLTQAQNNASSAMQQAQGTMGTLDSMVAKYHPDLATAWDDYKKLSDSVRNGQQTFESANPKLQALYDTLTKNGSDEQMKKIVSGWLQVADKNKDATKTFEDSTLAIANNTKSYDDLAMKTADVAKQVEANLAKAKAAKDKFISDKEAKGEAPDETFKGRQSLNAMQRNIDKQQLDLSVLQGKMVEDFTTMGNMAATGFTNAIKANQGNMEQTVAEVMDAVVAVGKMHLKVQSPSKVFEYLGAMTMEGMALGITDNAGKPVSSMEEALKALGGGSLEDASKILDVMEKAASTASSMADAMDKISKAADVSTEQIDNFVADSKYITMALVQGSDKFSKETLEAFGNYLDTMGKAASAASSMAELFDKLQGYSNMSIESINAFVDDTRYLMNAMYTASKAFDIKMLAAINLYSEAVGGIVEGLKDAVDLMDKIRGYSLVQIGYIDMFNANIYQLVNAFIAAALHFDTKMLAASKQYAETVGVVADNAQKALELLNKIREYSMVGEGHIEMFNANIFQLVNAFVAASSHFTATMITAASSYADTAGKVADSSLKLVELFDKIKNYSMIGEGFIEMFNANVYQLINAFVAGAQHFSTTMLTAAGNYADTSGKVADAVSKLVPAFEQLRTYTEVGLTQINLFSSDLNTIVQNFATAAQTYKDGALAKASEYADTSGKVAETVGKGVEALPKLATYTKSMKDNFNLFFEDLQKMVFDFSETAAGYKQGALAAATEFANTGGTVADTIGKGVEGFKALRNYSRVPQDALIGFEDDIILAINTLIPKITKDIQAGLPKVKEFSDAAGSLIGAMSSALSFFKDFKDFQGVPVEGINAIINGILIAIDRVKVLPILAQGELLTAIKTFGEATSSLFGAMNTALGVFKDMNDLKNLPVDAVNGLVAAMVTVSNTAGTMAGNAQGPLMDNAKQFLDAANGIFGAIKQAADTLKSLKELEKLPTDGAQSVLNAIILTVTKMAEALAKSEEFKNTALQYRDNLKDGFQAIKDGAAAALEAAQKASESLNGVNNTSPGNKFTGGFIQGRASGGTSAGRPFWVGENGPELFWPGARGGYVINNATAMMNGLGGTGDNFYPSRGGAGAGGSVNLNVAVNIGDILVQNSGDITKQIEEKVNEAVETKVGRKLDKIASSAAARKNFNGWNNN